jgi:hypothetical protein
MRAAIRQAVRRKEGVIALLATLVVPSLWPTPVVGQVANGPTISFRFGGPTITIERRFVSGQPSPRRLSRDEWATASQYDMAYGQRFSVNLTDLFPSELACRRYFRSASVTYDLIASEFKNSIYDWEGEPTNNPSISRLVVPPELSRVSELDKSEHYRIEEDDLRDFRGEKQLFVHFRNVYPDKPSIVNLGIRFLPHVNIRVSFSDFECFIREGVTVTRLIKDFFVRRTTHP